MEKDKKWSFETIQLHAGQEDAEPGFGACALPIYQTAAYVFDDCDDAAARFGLSSPRNIYTRLNNPTQDIFEKRIAALEGGTGALALASGMAAITYAIMNIATNGDNIVSAKTIYGGTYNLFAHTLPDYGITTSFVDPDNLEAFEKAINSRTKAVFIESMGNPNSNIVDFEKLADLAHKHKIPLIVDNTFGTPYLFRPIEHGADIVVHSATKFIGGQGAALGGVVVDSGKFDWEKSGKFPQLCEPNESYHGLSFTKAAGAAAYIVKMRATILRDTGAAISPFNAFMLFHGIQTLSLRVERHVENTMKILDYLKKHRKVKKINHPAVNGGEAKKLFDKYFPKGGGTIFTIEIDGGEKEAHKFINLLKIFSLVANVADLKSLVIHPGTTTHSQLNLNERAEQGIYPGTVRLSVGTENASDLIADLEQAFQQI